jgi:hypothetical protein
MAICGNEGEWSMLSMPMTRIGKLATRWKVLPPSVERESASCMQAS